MESSRNRSAITWKYPSVILRGDDSVGEFYSVAVTTNMQQADTGTKMIHTKHLVPLSPKVFPQKQGTIPIVG